MAKQNDVAARAAAIASRPRRTSAGAGDSAAPESAKASQAPIRTKPIRVTVDLLPNVYKELDDFGRAAAAELGVARVPHVQVVRALIQRLEQDEALRAATIQAIRDARA